MMARTIGRALCTLLAVLWAVTGISKLVSFLFPANQGLVHASWSAQFPVSLVILVSFIEIGIATMLLAGYRRAGLALGLILLSVFSTVILLFPPTEAQTCGCLGDLVSLDANDLLARATLLTGVHALGWALVLPHLPRTPESQTGTQSV